MAAPSKGGGTTVLYIPPGFMGLPDKAKSRVVGALALAIVAFSACAERAPQDYLEPDGPVARRVDRLWDVTFLIAVVVFVLVQAALVYAIIRFRRRPGREPAQFHGNTRVEVLHTVIPALILAGLAIPTVDTLFDLSQKQPNSLNVTVTAKQFWWQYEYTDHDVLTANELHIPTNQPVALTLLGEDVIHSFWVPKLSGKQDVVPGRVNYLTLEAGRPGTYLGQCTEYCGLSHANMRLRVIAHAPGDFETWLSEQQRPAASPASGDAAGGERLFLQGECINCHAIEGTDAQATTGPDLTHFASRETLAGAMFVNNEENLARWLRDPPGVKPGAKMPDYGLSEDEIRQLVAYLQTLD